jgi:predicted  nucleic acid-binding Zn-ribbon protein
MKNIKFYLLALSLILFGQGLLFSQVSGVKLTGKVEENNQPVVGHEVRVRFQSNDPFDTIAITDSDGVYTINKEFQNNSTGGVFLYTLEDCDRTAINRYRIWNVTEGSNVVEDFELCIDTSGDCRVTIVGLPNPAGGFDLIARSEIPQSYEWSTGETSQIIRVTEGGIYCVTVTNQFGCRSSDCFTLLGSVAVRCNVSIVTRFSHNPDEVFLEAVPKGIGPYRYLWSTGDTSQVISVRQEGTYCVTLTDITTNCSQSSCFVVRAYHFGQGTNCNVWFSVTENMGVFTLRAQNNRPLQQVSYEWSTGETTETIQVLQPGIYCLTATFSDSCVAEFCGPVIRFNSGSCSVAIDAELLDTTGLYRLTAIPLNGDFARVVWSDGTLGPTTEARAPGTICVTVVYLSGCRAKKCIILGADVSTLKDDNSTSALASNTSVSLFPNPAGNLLNVNLDGLNSFGQIEFVILDLNGRPVKKQLYDGDNSSLFTQIDLSDLIAGNYILSISTDSEVKALRFSKQ